jgi:CubicO group peptidase (beta-lactamase class C family)
MRPDRRTVLAGLAAAVLAPAARARALDFAAAAAYSAERRGVSLIVMQAGEILFEDYPGGGSIGAYWELASGTKSFSGIVAAAAAADGLLALDERAAETLPEWEDDDRKSRITLRQLLTLTSGVVDDRVGRPASYDDSIAAPARAEPGTVFAYGPTPFQIFGEIMRRKLAAAGGPADAVAYLESRVLTPIGVRIGRWRRGRRDGLPLMPQGAQLTARDWAGFGQFVLDGGAGLDPATLAACFEPTRLNPGYGLTWWLLRKGLIPPSERAGVDGAVGDDAVAEDIVMAAGAGDQRLYLLRARGLVVARQADGILRLRRGPKWRDEEFLRALRG